MAKKKKSAAKKKKSGLTAGVCKGGLCIWEEGVGWTDMCIGDCESCDGTLARADGIVQVWPCQSKKTGEVKKSHKVTESTCMRLPNGDYFYACYISVSDKPRKGKAKRKTKK